MEDIDVACAQPGCGEIRIFTVKDQEFYREKGFNPPRYCRPHSKARRTAREMRENENQQHERDNWPDRAQGPHIPGQEHDSENF